MTTWTQISDYAPSLDISPDLDGKPPILVERLISFTHAHELCLIALGDRERQLNDLKRKGIISVCCESRQNNRQDGEISRDNPS